MKIIYNLTTKLMNGTVTMKTHVDSFATKELAEKAREAVIEANKDLGKLSVFCEVQESKLFEKEEDVSILNKEKENGK